jgi:hypothetical protein
VVGRRSAGSGRHAYGWMTAFPAGTDTLSAVEPQAAAVSGGAA